MLQVRQLLSAGVSPNIKLSYNEFSPLHFAVHPPGNAELLQLLVVAADDVDPLDKELHTPLHDTVDPECAEILLKSGARIDRRTHDAETVLHRVANFSKARYHRPPPEEDSDPEDKDVDADKTKFESGLSKLSMQETLIVGAECEQDAAERAEKKYSPKKYYVPPWDGESKQVECARVMIKAGEKVSLDINAKDKAGMTALHVAALCGGSNMMRLLLNHGAEVNGGTVAAAGITPLHRAAVSGYMECGKVLLEAGAAVNRADMHGDTALHWAAQRGHRRFSRLLLRHGANRMATNKRGETARELALKGGHAKVIALFAE